MEESYLVEYSEYEDKIFTHCTSAIYLRPVIVSAPDPSPISIYGESTKTTSFSILGFSSMNPQFSIDVAVALF